MDTPTCRVAILTIKNGDKVKEWNSDVIGFQT